MKISSIDIPSVYRGLPPVKMSGLKEVVLLAGPNGGGKSRLLQAVGNYARAIITPEEVDRQHEAINNTQRIIASYESQASQLLDKGVNDHRVADYQRHAARHREEIIRIQDALRDGEIVKTEPIGRKPIVVDYRVNKLELKDSRAFKLGDMLQAGGHMASDFNVGLSPEYGLAAIHELLYLHVHEEDALRKAALSEKVTRLKQLIKDLLGTELGYTGISGPTLFGKPISETGLSQGQVVLLQIVMSLFFQDGSADDLILLLDEPEVHLHPIAVLQLLDHLRSSCPHAQIWIATHSLHLLAHFDQEFVWFVKDGVVQKAGFKRMEVLHSLVGDEKGVDELSTFLTLPVKSAALSFASQCMLAPSAVDTPAGDPQTSQIRDVIRSLLKKFDAIRLLDFGMGKGRLLAELEANLASGAESLVREIDYYGFDPEATAEDQELCMLRLASVFPRSKARYSTTIKELRGINRNSIHLVVMCNVLHEVLPEQWTKVFGKDGYLTDLLDPNGFLLIVEDQLLKVGERAHAFGFLVLSGVELRILFGCEQEDGSFVTMSHPEQRYASRLKAHLVPAKLVANLTPQSAREAISELKANALREVQRLQGEQYSNSAAREYAFWSHQFVNASLALGS